MPARDWKISPNYTRVTYELSSKGGGSVTKLDITGENFRDKAKYDDSTRFWDTILPKLKALMES
ncbi:MAG: hypothetical protein ACREBS_01200 [Nitrososphaerales archaeon]